MDGSTVVKLVEEALKEKKISKADFYKAVGISSATFSQWRNRLYSPSAANIKKIEDFLKIKFEYSVSADSEKGDKKAAVQKDSGYMQDDEDTEEYIRLISQLSPDGRRGAIIDLRKRLAHELLQGSEDTQE